MSVQLLIIIYNNITLCTIPKWGPTQVIVESVAMMDVPDLTDAWVA